MVEVIYASYVCQYVILSCCSTCSYCFVFSSSEAMHASLTHSTFNLAYYLQHFMQTTPSLLVFSLIES